MKKLTIEIIKLPDNDGYEARIPELGEAVYRGCGDSEKEALESLGLVMFDVENEKICKNCSFWNRQDKLIYSNDMWGICENIQIDSATCDDDYYDPKATTSENFWCCDFEERKGSRK